LTAGAAFAGACFLVALGGEQLGVEGPAGEMTDVIAVLQGLPALSPWAWASLGTYAVLVTPVVGLAITAWEYAAVKDRRTVMLAAGVLTVLAISLVAAILL
jgi:uncharacterized membrane protein